MKRLSSSSHVAATVASRSLVAVVKPLQAAVVTRKVGTWVYQGIADGSGADGRVGGAGCGVWTAGAVWALSGD